MHRSVGVNIKSSYFKYFKLVPCIFNEIAAVSVGFLRMEMGKAKGTVVSDKNLMGTVVLNWKKRETFASVISKQSRLFPFLQWNVLLLLVGSKLQSVQTESH